MTTESGELPQELGQELPEEQPPVYEEQEPHYQVSFERLAQLERSAVHLLAARLTGDSPSRAVPSPESSDPAALVREIQANHDSDPEFIRSDMPIQEIVFRTLLARGNEPMPLADLHYELTERWATPIRPIAITEERLERVLDADIYYGFMRV
jgi:hypothetical protein